MDAKPAKQRKLNVSLTQGTFPVIFFANKFGIEIVAGEPLVHFGCVTESAGTLGCFAAVFEMDMLRKEKENWGKFLAAIGGPKTKPDSLFRCTSSRLATVPCSNVVLWHRHGESGEICLHSISQRDVYEAVNDAKDSVHGQSIALIRCSTELQRQLMAALLDLVYDEK